MWTQLVTLTVFLVIVNGEERLQSGPGNIERVVSDGVRSVGYKVVYGDQDMDIINEVVNDAEKRNVLKDQVNLNEVMRPLPAQDVKCLMSVDRYCTKEMRATKSVLIRAVKQDCSDCTKEEKEKAGKVIAAMLTHDHVAWKLFLTRCALLMKKEEDPLPKPQNSVTLKRIGEPEILRSSSRNSYKMPGTKVRVRRYVSELVTH